MGTYLNPGNDGFQTIRNGIYVDKTGLIDYINRTISTSSKLTCFSRPRRFGKSFAAKMLCAYYDRSCDSKTLFTGLEISKMDSFSQYLNKYDVIFLDITWFISTTTDIRHVVSDLQNNVIRELQAAFPDAADYTEPSLPRVLSDISDKTGKRFVIIIDEWDALFREAKHDDALQKEYIQLLRGLFKGGISTDRMIAAAYMTGILPIKKYGTESALTDFNEFSMTNPSKLARYVGFTQDEVQNLCQTFHMDFETMRIWYDGYAFSRVRHVYSPNSVIKALQNEEYQNYWTSSETYESLKSYISMNLDGLKDTVIAMLGGQPQKVETLYFQNDLTSLTNKNHVLTLLVHLGYLAYDQKTKAVSIPNLEVADSFRLAVQDSGWEKIGAALENSEDLLAATIRGDCRAVENALEEIHYAKSSILEYNNENSLACAITIAYYTAKRFYEIFRELPSGKGFADVVFLPHKDTDKPAILIELKYNKSADAAIQQIKDRRYTGKLSDYKGNLLLVRINYNKDSIGKKHECVMEWFQQC
ncbi:MAG: ATP-binding protein [Clostridiales bacterium]|nr:ATP-binding protein [Clostridiales bacterium]